MSKSIMTPSKQLCDNCTSMPITIDTKGLHPATAACLEALVWLEGQHTFASILDMGCGNGILSLTAAGLWDARVLAVDIAPQAVADTTANIAAHQRQSQVTPLRSDGFAHPAISERAPYDLIICNLLAEPIVQMAPLMKQHLVPNGICLFSGILSWLAQEVETTYQSAGFSVLHRLTRSPWETYLLQV